MSRSIFVLSIIAIMAAPLSAQSVISAKAGLIHDTQGDVFLEDKQVIRKFGDFPEMKENQTLRTELGRAEVLLTPGSFLRVAEDSSFKLIKRNLDDVEVEVLSGSVLLEVAEVLKGHSMALISKGARIDVTEPTLIRIDVTDGKVKVYDGEATVTANGQSLLLKEGRYTSFTGVLAATKFNPKVGDAFYRWASSRARSISVANLYAARTVDPRQVFTGGWFFNPYLGMFSYVPVRGYYNSPFGYRYYSPGAVMAIYNPRPVMPSPDPYGGASMRGYADRGGYSSSMSTSGDRGGYSSAPVSVPAAPSAPAAAAPARSSDSGSSRESSSGR